MLDHQVWHCHVSMAAIAFADASSWLSSSRWGCVRTHESFAASGQEKCSRVDHSTAANRDNLRAFRCSWARPHHSIIVLLQLDTQRSHTSAIVTQPSSHPHIWTLRRRRAHPSPTSAWPHSGLDGAWGDTGPVAIAVGRRRVFHS